MKHDKEALTNELVWAADGHLETVRELIAADADGNGMPLIMAIQCDEPEIIQTLIDAGSNVNIYYRDTTPLIRAISASYHAIVRLLIDAGADVNQSDAKGQTPLAASQGQLRLNATLEERDAIIQMLKAEGATH